MPRPPVWTEKKKKSAMNKLCFRLAKGRSLRSICEDDDMPDPTTIYDWMDENEAFAQQYARARDLQTEHFVDEMNDIAENVPDVQRAKLMIDTRKWVASKLKSHKYGDKIDHNVQGNVTFVVETGVPERPDDDEETQDDQD